MQTSLGPKYQLKYYHNYNIYELIHNKFHIQSRFDRKRPIIKHLNESRKI